MKPRRFAHLTAAAGISLLAATGSFAATTGTAGADPLSVWQCSSLYPSTSPFTTGSVWGSGCSGSGLGVGDFTDQSGNRVYRCRQFYNSYNAGSGLYDVYGTSCEEYQDS